LGRCVKYGKPTVAKELKLTAKALPFRGWGYNPVKQIPTDAGVMGGPTFGLKTLVRL